MKKKLQQSRESAIAAHQSTDVSDPTCAELEKLITKLTRKIESMA